MENSPSPSKQKDGTDDEEEEEEEVLFSFHHIRTASVILRSGDRVRRKISLMSMFDESPFEEDNDRAPLLDPRGTAGTSYSSIAPNLVDRQVQLWEKPNRLDTVKIWLHSEGLKRYCPCS